MSLDCRQAVGGRATTAEAVQGAQSGRAGRVVEPQQPVPAVCIHGPLRALVAHVARRLLARLQVRLCSLSSRSSSSSSGGVQQPVPAVCIHGPLCAPVAHVTRRLLARLQVRLCLEQRPQQRSTAALQRHLCELQQQPVPAVCIHDRCVRLWHMSHDDCLRIFRCGAALSSHSSTSSTSSSRVCLQPTWLLLKLRELLQKQPVPAVCSYAPLSALVAHIMRQTLARLQVNAGLLQLCCCARLKRAFRTAMAAAACCSCVSEVQCALPTRMIAGAQHTQRRPVAHPACLS